MPPGGVRRPRRSAGTGPADRRTRVHGKDVAYGPIRRNCSSASSHRSRPTSTYASRFRTSAGHGSPGPYSAESAIAPSAAASIRSRARIVAPPPSVSSAKAARTGRARTSEPGSASSAARSAKSKHSRCEPYQGRQVLQGRDMTAVVVRGAADRLPHSYSKPVWPTPVPAGVVEGDPPRHRVARLTLGRRGDQRAHLAQQFGPGGGLPGPRTASSALTSSASGSCGAAASQARATRRGCGRRRRAA